MPTVDSVEKAATLDVQNVGGISTASVELPPGVTVLSGRNATNRTSLLRSIMAALGSDDVSLKGDADEGRVELTVDDETYDRTLRRTNGSVSLTGNPYLDDPTTADLFAFLLGSNEARRAVVRNEDLRELIMRPVDTDAIQAEIDRLEHNRDQIEEQLDELDELKGELPSLEQRRTTLETKIDEKRADLAEKEAEIDERDADVGATRARKQELEDRLDALHDLRSELERVRSEIELHEESIQSLRNERAELSDDLEDLPDEPMGDHEELDRKIDQLRERKQSLEARVSDLQDVIQFNEELLAADADAVGRFLGGGQSTPDELTGQLVEDDSVVCWTCGSQVERDRISDTLDQLRSIRQDRLDEVRDVDDELEELRETQRERERQQERRDRIERKLGELDDELDRRTDELENLREERERLNEEIGTTEAKIEEAETEDVSEVLDLHKEANQLEFKLGQLESELDDVNDRIAEIEDRLAGEDELRSRLQHLRTELQEQRTRIDRIEREAVDAFNEHMEEILDLLVYENLERIWIERVQTQVREGRQTVERTVFELHIVRTTDGGTTYEDTIDHLSESEREVTGLTFALAGYLVHDLHETVPFMLLDSLEAIDADRLATLVEYFADYAPFLVVALLPEDAQTLSDVDARITEI